MKLHRSALMAGLLALGVAACGDDVQVIEPTPPVPPPPPPLAASMSPASATVAIGGSVVFAVNASGGVAGESASWSCSSSNTGIATASTTSAGCAATGVAGGSVTVTASVSKGNETVNVGAQLTVSAAPEPPPFEASIAPAAQSVAVGSSVVFAVNTSGGHTGMMMDGMMAAASWECSSSDPAIATVEGVDAGCSATGVAAGEVTVNAAATDGYDTVNLVAQLTVTDDPVVPTTPFAATMAPESATVLVGSSAIFAINTTGGDPEATVAWACTSSSDDIATVENADAGCSATGVAAGGVTVNASVTRGEETRNLASQLTVTAPDVGAPAFVVINTISGEDDSDVSGLEGRVDVTINVERGDQVLEGLSLLVDGAVVSHQSFGAAASPPMDEAAEQAVHQFTMSFDSHDYDRETGVPVYTNGDHSIASHLAIADSEAPIASNDVSVEFKNSDFIATSMSGLGSGAMNATTGQIWYGGPDASVGISALPVLYSSGGVSALTLLTFCGDEAATDSEAPFSFEVDCGGFQGSDTPTFSVGGDDITARGGEVYLDFKAPDAPNFQPDPNKREDGWVNASVGFTAEYEDKKGKRDGWLVYNDDAEDNDADDGVGGYTPQIRFAESGDDNEVGGALGAPALAQLVLPPTLAGQSSKKDFFCVVVSATDLLGNESKLPDADADCVSAGDYDAEDDDNSAGLLAGVDLQDPTITFSPASPKADAATMRNFQVQLADEGSGIREDSSPLKAAVNLRDKDDDEEVEDLEISVSLPLATTVGIPDGVGYYSFTGSVTDKAGNVSEEATRTALHDTDDPAASTIVGDYDEKKGQFSMVATVTDNLSIKAYWSEARFGTAALSLDAVNADGIDGTAIEITQGLFLPQEGETAVDAYNAASLTQATLAADLTVKSYRGLQGDDDDDGSDITGLNSLGVVASDHGGQKSVTPSQDTDLAIDNNGTIGFDLTASEIPATDEGVESVEDSDRETFTGFTAEVDQSGGDVEVTVEASGPFFVMPVVEVVAVEDDANTPDVDETVKAVAAVTGNEGLRDNPLARVDFYATTTTFDIDGDDDTDETVLKYIGSVDGSAAGAQDFDDDQITTDPVDANDSRKYIYTMTISESALADAVGSKGDYTGHIVAFGVKDNEGAALAAPAVPVEIEK